MHGSSRIPELYLYVGHGYFKYFCTRVHNFLSDKMHFAYSSAQYIYPHTSDIINPGVPQVIPYGEGYLDGKEPHHQWYRTEIEKPTDQSSDSNPKPKTQVTWSDDTNPPALRGITTPFKSRDFLICIDLKYCDVMINSVAVVYKGASADSLTHNIRLEVGSKLQIHDSNLQLIDKPDFSNLPKNPLDYRNEVGPGLTLQETQDLAQTRTLSLLQQDIISCHHRI